LHATSGKKSYEARIEVWAESAKEIACLPEKQDIIVGLMKKLRRACIGLIVIGAVLLFFQTDSDFDTLPLPAAGLSVKMYDVVKKEANFHLVIGIPFTDDESRTNENTVPCSLAVRIALPNKETISSEVTSLVPSGYYGYAGVQTYEGGNWHLKPGKYHVEVKSLKRCEAAMSRGATVCLEQEIVKPTEQYLQAVLRHWCGIWFLLGGIIGLVLCEFKRT
jgi:hypothetical protein